MTTARGVFGSARSLEVITFGSHPHDRYQTLYERAGDVANVTFPCGYTLDADGDTLNIYYGAADTSIALATGSVRALLGWLAEHGS